VAKGGGPRANSLKRTGNGEIRGRHNMTESDEKRREKSKRGESEVGEPKKDCWDGAPRVLEKSSRER